MVKKKITRAATKKRTIKKPAKSKFSRTSKPLKKRFKDRFQKFYYLHRPAINANRRKIYETKKRKGICVKCFRKSLKTSIFCSFHRKKSREHNKK